MDNHPTNPRPASPRFALYWGPVLVYMALIFVVSAQSKLPHITGPLGWDKLHHAASYAVLTLLSLRAAARVPIAPSVSPSVQALIITLVYGASDEFHQHFVPGRSMDIFDWLADATGAVIALAAAWLVRRAMERHRSRG